MFGLIRFIITCVFIGGLAYCGATVELGQHTFFGHVSRIWSSDETQDLVEGVKEKGEPVLDKLEKSVKAGYDEYTSEDAGSGTDNTGEPGD